MLNKTVKENWVIFKYRAGSHLYGLDTPNSDLDYRYVFIPPKEYWVGGKSISTQENIDDRPRHILKMDEVGWDLRYFCKNIVRASPNILETLFVNEENIIKQTPTWWEIKFRMVIKN